MTNPRVPRVVVTAEEDKDLGFGSVVGGINEARLLNRDGTFNPKRKGRPFWTSLSPYHYMLTISWAKFFALVALAYFAANASFALAYMACGRDALTGVAPQDIGGLFLRAFFFSVETFATVGYGNISPVGVLPNVIVTMESLVGLLGFALATGVLFSRFSRPTAAIQFSDVGVVTPYRGITAFMFRIVNARSNQLLELEAKLLYSRIEGSSRKYDQLTLERTRVVFFPLAWTIVHPIDEKSPLWGLEHADLVARDAEFMILLSGTDETFSQTVHARISYKPGEIVYGRSFVNLYNPVDDGGVVSIDVRKLSDTEPAHPDHEWKHTTSWHSTGHFAGYAPPRPATKTKE